MGVIVIVIQKRSGHGPGKERLHITLCEIELCMQQGLVMRINFNFIAMVSCTVVWESPLLTCVCAEVLGETRTNGRRNLQP